MEILNLKSHCGAFSWLPSSVYKLPHLSLQQVEHSLSGTFKHFLCNVANIWICNYGFFLGFIWPQRRHCSSWHCAAKLHDILWSLFVEDHSLGWSFWSRCSYCGPGRTRLDQLSDGGGGKADGGTRRWTEHGLSEPETTKHTDPDLQGTLHGLEVVSLWFYKIFGVVFCDWAYLKSY